jgi:hypothetical protein
MNFYHDHKSTTCDTIGFKSRKICDGASRNLGHTYKGAVFAVFIDGVIMLIYTARINGYLLITANPTNGK